MNNDKIKIEDRLTIEIIDRKTGQVISRETWKPEGKGSINQNGAVILVSYIAGQVPDPAELDDWKYIYLFDSSKNIIKYLTGTWGTVTATPTYVFCIVTAVDDSGDSYETRYQGLYPKTDATAIGQMYITQTQTKTKTSEQILRATWEVRVPYSAYP